MFRYLPRSIVAIAETLPDELARQRFRINVHSYGHVVAVQEKHDGRLSPQRPRLHGTSVQTTRLSEGKIPDRDPWLEARENRFQVRAVPHLQMTIYREVFVSDHRFDTLRALTRVAEEATSQTLRR
ncbi:hypothetical protein [Rhizobium sp. FKL33]|uniref:hypothetical protein n=1 Tax=Rhizobium sp. FKL33 TaxID=2562307 RepID=UPI0010C12E01|nr:hypothetical protein [Rhizobium sp. FKL33]